MSKIAVFIVLIIFVAVTAVLLLNKNNTTTVTPNITINTPSPTTAVLAATTSASISVSPTISATLSSTPTTQVAQTAIIKTSKGDIQLQLYPDQAPKTVSNFLSKSQSGFYNNLTFHRVEDWVIQGGDPKGDGTGGGTMPTELNKQPFVTGSLGVARGQDITISNDAQFFITKQDASWLNGQYTNFGIVTKGMDVVNKIQIGDKILGITAQ